MWSPAQVLYFEEVLGIQIDEWVRRLPVKESPTQPQSERMGSEPSPTEVPVMVLTPPLSKEGHALLKKILASAQIADAPHRECEAAGVIPTEGLRAKHWLLFSEENGEGSSQTYPQGVVWRLPTIASMLEGEHIARNKRTVWTLLQRLTKELKEC